MFPPGTLLRPGIAGGHSVTFPAHMPITLEDFLRAAELTASEPGELAPAAAPHANFSPVCICIPMRV